MAKSDIVFVNADKRARAEDIVMLATGKRPAKNDAEAERQNYWAAELEGATGDPVRFVYEKLGGLIRTDAQEKEAQAKKAAIKAKKGKAKGK